MGKQNFTLINDTGLAIRKIFISPADDNSWEDDILASGFLGHLMGRDVLQDGEEIEITFDRSEAADLWDLKVEDADGEEYIWEDFDLSTISRITLEWDGETTSATWE